MRIYRAELPKTLWCPPDSDRLNGLLDTFKNRKSQLFEMQRKKGPITIDLKQTIQKITIESGDVIMLHINPEAKTVPRIHEIIGEIFELSPEIRTGLRITKVRP